MAPNEKSTYFQYHEGIDTSVLRLGNMAFDYANPKMKRPYVHTVIATKYVNSQGLLAAKANLISVNFLIWQQQMRERNVSWFFRKARLLTFALASRMSWDLIPPTPRVPTSLFLVQMDQWKN